MDDTRLLSDTTCRSSAVSDPLVQLLKPGFRILPQVEPGLISGNGGVTGKSKSRQTTHSAFGGPNLQNLLLALQLAKMGDVVQLDHQQQEAWKKQFAAQGLVCQS